MQETCIEDWEEDKGFEGDRKLGRVKKNELKKGPKDMLYVKR